MNNTLVKGLHLLETLARHGRPMGVTEVAEALGLPKSGAHRLLQALVDEGYVARRDSGSYAVSIKLWELGSAALTGFDLRRHADPMMERLMQETGESVHLSVLDRHEVVYVHKVECADPVRAYTHVGARVPAHCVATGKVLMAYQGPAWLADGAHAPDAATMRALTARAALSDELRDIRRVGYGVNLGGWRDTVNGLAAPVLDGQGGVVAAIGISGPASRLGEARLLAMAFRVCEVGRALSATLGRAAEHASLLGVLRHWTDDAAA